MEGDEEEDDGLEVARKVIVPLRRTEQRRHRREGDDARKAIG